MEDNGMNDQVIKIFGERNTGTNYLEQLIENNLSVKQLPGITHPYLLKIRGKLKLIEYAFPSLSKKTPWNKFINFYLLNTKSINLGWKHSAPDYSFINRYSESNKLFIVTLTRNPYSWLLSLYKKPYGFEYIKREKLSFDDFINYLYNPLIIENMDAKLNLIQLWNEKNRSYLNNQIESINVKFEDLITDPASIISSIATTTNCSFDEGEFINVQQSTKNEKNKDNTYYRDYYENEKWRQSLSNGSIDNINKYLNEDVMKSYGYDFI
jgi:hypothetical protein